MAPKRSAPLGATLLGAALVALLGAAFALGSPAPASAQSAKTLGHTPFIPAPACPQNTNRNPCQAIGSVTGFQMRGQDRPNLMRAREDGHLLAFAIRLSRPTNAQRQFFGSFYESPNFGTRPHARISILNRVEGNRFRLLRQSAPVDLTSALGSRQIYTLNQPLRIRRGQILALTVPSWAPAFAVELPARRNTWRASRAPGRCVSESDLRASRPHQGVDSVRRYACTYRTARLLYWGYYVPDD